MDERVALDVMFQREVREYARIGNAKEKEPLFQWQPQQLRPQQIVGVECPNSHLREEGIPKDEKATDPQVGQEKVLPVLIELDVFIKTQDQGQGEHSQIHSEVQPFELIPLHQPAVVCRLARMARRASTK